MKINCTSCGHSIDLGINYDDYQGPVKCWVCSAMLEVKAESGQVRSVIPWSRVSEPKQYEEAISPSSTKRIIQ
ncbi:hypothetical protein [Spartinivicinus poritis]|uniref:Uncharacterized protein n=1 Tax=Spartinivicinus poritis TaxID=2994640 RepID=A0ABT5U7T5_9GAMM|nr:hypothetical protein [Spartinivicinus sp. A2-2]MDE1461473.1 hypothetical protein [Spartinivicinus sp. A2-2]